MLVVLLKIVENGHNGNENMKRTSVSVSRTIENGRTSEGLTLRSYRCAKLLKYFKDVSREFDEFRVNFFFFFFFILRRMGSKNKALAHHTPTYFHTRRVCVDLTQLLSQPNASWRTLFFSIGTK